MPMLENGKIAILAVMVASACFAQDARSVSLSGEWQFRKGGTQTWTTVEVPHDWAAAGPFDADDKADADMPDLILGFAFTGKLPWRGTGRYRRMFTLTPDDMAGAVRLEFDGVMARPKVYVNGRYAGGWDYGYMGFVIDVTSFVIAGTNTLEVAADTTRLNARWHPGGGIYRDVRLVCTGRNHVVPGTLSITAPEVSRNRATVRVEYDSSLDGHTNFSFAVDSPRLWDFDDPHLYDIDILGETFRYGIRTMEFTADDGFRLNGRRVQLKGANLHHDLGILGVAMDPDARRRQLLILKDMGVNAIRTSHNPIDPFTLDLCDEMGFVVWNECFDKWSTLGGRLAEEDRDSYVLRNLEAFVRRDRNHPCVAIWSIGNEIRPTSESEPDGMTRERCRLYRDAIKSLDPTRPVGAGCCHAELLKDDTLADLDVIGWNYNGGYRLAREKFPAKPLVYTESASAVSSYGYYCNPPPGGRLAYDIASREIDSYDHCSAPSTDIADREFERMAQDRYCAGEFVWTALDYIGEATPYLRRSIRPTPAWLAAIPERELARSSYFGAVDLTGMPKDRFFLYRAHWNDKAETVHVLPHWNWGIGEWGTGNGERRVPVYVYTSGDEAELFLNGRSLGRRRKAKGVFRIEPNRTKDYEGDAASDFRTNTYYAVCDKYRLRWFDVPYEPGELRAVAYRGGREIGESRVCTAGAPVRLRLERDPYSPLGARTVFVKVAAVDSCGTSHPLASNRVHFTVEGGARLAAVGNGNARAYDSFGGDSYPLYNGAAMAVVRFAQDARSAVLKVSSDGLEPAELVIERVEKRAGRIAVLDMNLSAGVSNRFGCASSPSSFVRALGGKYDVRIVNHANAVPDGAFDTAKTDMLIIPSGSLFPQEAAKEIVAFLKNGGLMITIGGYAFDEPMDFLDGKWRLPGGVASLPSPVGTKRLAFPPKDDWKFNTLPGTQTLLKEATYSNRGRAVKVSTPYLLAYNLAVMPVSSEDVSDARALCFRAKTDSGLRTFRVEITELDGSRWKADIPASAEWKDYALSWEKFAFHPGSPTKGKRGGVKDRVRFHEAVQISFGITHGNGNPLRRPHTLWIADLMAGDDPAADSRKPPVAQARINTKIFPLGGKEAVPRPDQIGVFSPAYRLKDVVSIQNDPATDNLFSSVAFKGTFGGWDASAMLTPKVNGHAENCVAYRPVLACLGGDGSLRGRAACLAYNYGGVFKGSSWALFGIDNRDLFVAPEADAFLLDVVDALFRRVYLAVTKPKWSCWRPGETAEFETTVKNFSADAASGEVVFTLADEQGRIVSRAARPFRVSPRSYERLVMDWLVPKDAGDFYRLKAELAIGGRVVDREETAIAVWNEETIANGPKVGIDGTFFTVNGRRQFLMGAQASVARQLSHTSGSALRFYEDFKSMKSMGMSVSRNFFALDSRTKEPERTRILRLMDANVLLSQKFGIVNYFNHNCDNAIPLDEAGRKAEADFIASIAERYKNVPGFMMDVRNEPRLYMAKLKKGEGRSPRELAGKFLVWGHAASEGAHRGNPSVAAATGWCQGWGSGQYFMDPPTAAAPFDFTDAHFYGSNDEHSPEINKIDRRIFGMPAVMGEFGCYFHPLRWPDSCAYATIDEAARAVDEEAARRYRCQAVRTFGCGYALACNYGWADLIEGVFTFALCHWDGNLRPIAGIYSNLARTLSRLTPADNPPDTVLLIPEKRLSANTSERDAAIASYYGLCNARAWHGVNFSVLPASERPGIPDSVKLVISADDFKGDDIPSGYGNESALRRAIGRKIRSAGVVFARRDGDPDTLEIYRVPGVGATAWLFWNGDERSAVTVSRGGHRLTIGAERGGYLQIADYGKLEVAEEL